MSTEKHNRVTTQTFLSNLFSPANRVGVTIGLSIITLVIALFVFFFFYYKKDLPANVKTPVINAQSVQVEANAKLSSAYQEAMKEQNKERYDREEKREGGVSLPFTFDQKAEEIEEGKDISNCGCKIDDEQLRRQLEALGIGNQGAKQKKASQLAQSDIYLDSDLRLRGHDDEPLVFRGAAIFMDSKSQLVSDSGAPLLSREKEPMFLGKTGNLVDQHARVVKPAGDLLTSKGIVFANDGRLVTRPGNMQQVGRSDIYLSIEGQLVTIDGRPIRNNGTWVYQSDEKKLVNRSNGEIAWEEFAVYQNTNGQLVNVAGNKFKTPGILFSYDGILIDNDGMLTKPLVDITRIGDGDIYIDGHENLIDASGMLIKHYSVAVKLRNNKLLKLVNGSALKNRFDAEIHLTPRGVLEAEVGKGQAQSGILKTSAGVAYDQQGELVTRRGKLEQRGASDIFLTPDGLLTDKDGRSFLFNTRDAFVDYAEVSLNGAQALETHLRTPIINTKGERVYLTLDGRLVNKNGNLISDTGILTSSDGVLMTSSGKKVFQEAKQERVVTKDGSPVTYNGKEVYKGADGRLYDKEGNPILDKYGRAVYLDAAGSVVDEQGRTINDVKLMAGDRAVVNGELTTRKALTTRAGEKILFGDKEVFIDDSRRLVDDQGKPILSKDGKEVFLDKDGNVVDAFGNKIEESLLKTASGKDVSSQLVAGREQVVTKDGKAVTFNGQKVFKGSDGALYDEEGNAILAADGTNVYMNAHGQITDKSGNIIDEPLLRVTGDRFVKSGELSTRKQLTDANGNALVYNGKPVYTNDAGQLLDEHNNPVLTSDGRKIFVGKDGTLRDQNGKKIDEPILSSKHVSPVKNEELAIRERLLDSLGNELFVNGEKAYKDAKGRLVNEKGDVIKTKDGRVVYVSSDGSLEDANGKKIEEDILKTQDLQPVLQGDVSSRRKLLGKNGERITYQGEDAYVDDKGRLVNGKGELIKTKDGAQISIDQEGNLIDARGNKIQEPVLKAQAIKALDNKSLTTRRKLTGKMGDVVTYKGQDVYLDEQNRLVDEDGNLIKTANGEVVYVDNKGNLVDKSGKQINEPLLNKITKDPIKQGDLKTVTQLTGKNGESLTYQGKDVYIDSEGRVLDADGNLIKTADGKNVYVDSFGNLVSEDGEIITEPLLHDAQGKVVSSVKGNGKVKVTDKQGNAIQYKGKDVFTAKDGTLIDANGNAILTADGKKIHLNEKGELVDADGRKVKDANFSVRKVTQVSGGLQTGKSQITDKEGNAIQYKGQDVFKEKDGSLIDANGLAILTADGKKIFMNKNGELVDSVGRKINNADFTVKQSKFISGGLTAGREQLTTTDGKQIKYQGKDVFKAADGSLVDDLGNPILNKDGSKLFINRQGEIVDANGGLVSEELLTTEGGQFVSSGLKTKPGQVTTKNGEAVLYQGKGVFTSQDGFLVDATGKAILTSDGKKVHMNKQGDLVDENGRRVDDALFTKEVIKPVTQGIQAGLEQVTTKDGTPIKYLGENVYKSSDGSLLDAQGNPILTRDGKKIFMTEHGALLDENDNAIDEEILTANGKQIKQGDLTTVPATDLRQVGNSDIYTAPDGTLLDAKGKAILYNGKKVIAKDDGQLFDEKGNAIVDRNGKAVFVSASGRLVDKEGKLLRDALITNGDGVLIGTEGTLVTNTLQRLGESDLYATKEGRVTDKDGKAIKFNGQDVYMKEDGQLLYANGNPVADSDGNSVYLDSTGNIVDKRNNPIKESVLTNAEGVLIDSEGHLITSGGKMTKIGSTGLYRTETGRIVNKDGKAVTMSGADVYTNKDDKIVNKLGKPIRFKSKEIYLSDQGRLTDAQGQSLMDDSGSAVELSETSVLVNDLGKTVTEENISGLAYNDVPATGAGNPAIAIGDGGKKPTTQKPSKRKNSARGLTAQTKQTTSTASATAQPSQSKQALIPKMDIESKKRLQERYSQVKQQMRENIGALKLARTRDVGSNIVAFSAAAASGLNESALADGQSNQAKQQSMPKADVVVDAGEILYGVLKHNMNSDYIKDVAVKIVGRAQNDPLNNATAFGKFELKYDNIVLTFSKIKLKDGKMVAMNGVALDPATTDAGLQSDIDHHYWYRFGGLFAATMLQGTSEAVGESGERTEKTNISGTTETFSGLKGDKLALRAMGKVGEGFSGILASNVSRPVTVTVDAGTEMAIILFDDVVKEQKGHE